jgi:uncharacterized protein (DUF433 family)
MPLPELPPFLTRWPDGEIVVTGTRVVLYHFVFHYNQGESAESLGARYPHIPLATLHKVIAFYLENRPAVDEFVKEYQAVLDRLREAGKKVDTVAFRRRLAAREVATPIEVMTTPTNV